MSRNPQLSSSLKRLTKNLNQTIAERATRLSEKVAETATEVFVHNAKARLDEATPKDGNSQALIDMVKNNISSYRSSSQRSSYTISVWSDSEGLNMFLEYGTGILGLAHGHEEESLVGWEHAVNLSEERPYVTHNGRVGWFFSSKRGTYIDQNDEFPVEVYRPSNSWISVSAHTRNDKPVRAYTRRLRKWDQVKVKQTSVFTQGLRPIRYFYRAKEDIRAVFNEIASLANDGAHITESKIIEMINAKKL